MKDAYTYVEDCARSKIEVSCKLGFFAHDEHRVAAGRGRMLLCHILERWHDDLQEQGQAGRTTDHTADTP